jgi:hypothetical protein
VVIFNEHPEIKHIKLSLGDAQKEFTINGQALQTIVIPKPE